MIVGMDMATAQVAVAAITVVGGGLFALVAEAKKGRKLLGGGQRDGDPSIMQVLVAISHSLGDLKADHETQRDRIEFVEEVVSGHGAQLEHLDGRLVAVEEITRPTRPLMNVAEHEQEATG